MFLTDFWTIEVYDKGHGLKADRVVIDIEWHERNHVRAVVHIPQ